MIFLPLIVGSLDLFKSKTLFTGTRLIGVLLSGVMAAMYLKCALYVLSTPYALNVLGALYVLYVLDIRYVLYVL